MNQSAGPSDHRQDKPVDPIPGFPRADPSPDEIDRQLDELFGPVTRWWIGELPGLGVMRLPLP